MNNEHGVEFKKWLIILPVGFMAVIVGGIVYMWVHDTLAFTILAISLAIIVAFVIVRSSGNVTTSVLLVDSMMRERQIENIKALKSNQLLVNPTMMTGTMQGQPAIGTQDSIIHALPKVQQ